jgi:hypothetical protein
MFPCLTLFSNYVTTRKLLVKNGRKQQKVNVAWLACFLRFPNPSTDILSVIIIEKGDFKNNHHTTNTCTFQHIS